MDTPASIQQAPSTPSSTSPRLHGLDALRGGALLLGIVLHATLAYVPGFPWLVRDDSTTPAFGVLSMWIHLFRMPLFLFIAGFFAHLSLERRGTRSFVKDRLKRIGLPFVVFAPLCLIALIAVGAWASTKQNMAPPEPPAGIPLWLLILSPGHLWFLWTLLQLYAIVLVGRWIVRHIPGASGLSRTAGDILTRPGGVLLAAIPYWIAIEATGKVVGGPVTLIPEWPSTVAFLGAFLVGWCCWAHPDALTRLRRQWPVHLALAVLLTAFALAQLGLTIQMEATIEPWWLRAALALAVWLWCYGLTGLCLQVFAGENPAIRYVADSSYWLYIVHLPLVIALQVLLLDLPWPAGLKALVVIIVALAILLASYHWLVRPTWLGRWLNGRSYPRRS